MPNLVTDIVVSEISLVDEGANPDALVEIIKSKDIMNIEQFTEALEEAGEKITALERHVEETEAEIVKQKRAIAEKDAEIERLKNTDPDAVLRAKATKIREANPKLTPEQAYVQAIKENPQLYADYVNKHRSPMSNTAISKQQSSDSEAMLKAKAEEIRRANPQLTVAQAYSQAMEENPQLYGDYLAKRRLALA